MKARIGITCLAAGMLALVGSMSQAQRSNLSYSDKHFMRDAARGGVAEVRLGELAVRQGSRQSVRDFGQKMIDDHSKANDNLKQVAANENFTLPDEMDDASRALYRRLSHLHGAAFDRAYIRAMREDHEKDIAAFRREANGGRDREVRDFASQTLPTLREHYRMINDIAGR